MGKRRIFSAPEGVLAVQGRSRSSKVDDFGTNRKRVYEFLLVGHCDYGPSCTVSEIRWLVYGQKTTRTKGHHRRNFVVYFDEVYNELCASKNGEKFQ